jgi:hypothetical protein
MKAKKPAKARAEAACTAQTDRLTLRLPLDSKRKAFALAQTRRCSMSRLVENLVHEATA